MAANHCKFTITLVYVFYVIFYLPFLGWLSSVATVLPALCSIQYLVLIHYSVLLLKNHYSGGGGSGGFWDHTPLFIRRPAPPPFSQHHVCSEGKDGVGVVPCLPGSWWRNVQGISVKSSGGQLHLAQGVIHLLQTTVQIPCHVLHHEPAAVSFREKKAKRKAEVEQKT